LAIPLKLGAIEQEHLQELYEATGVPRDELPYSPALSELSQSFQDRTFKNADEAQVYGAIVKYVRSSRCAKTKGPEPADFPAQAEHARVLRTHGPFTRKIQPYTPEFDAARGDFVRRGGVALSPHEFWRVLRIASERAPAKSRPARQNVSAADVAVPVAL
jgi:hypothetical protein